MHSDIPQIICIAGATGTGKSAIALKLAQNLGGAIINADSRQVYRDFPIITAQPSRQEQGLCPHLLYGFLPSAERINAGRYARMAAAAIGEQLGQGKLPILIGGTGLYFRSLLRGIADIPDIPPDIHAKWIEQCATMGSAALHELLRAADPDYAARIHPHDRQRITRALEVHEATSRPLSLWHREKTPSPEYDTLFLGIRLPKSELAVRLAQRINRMLELGALEEAEAALENCADNSAPGWSGIGCAELYDHLTGKIQLDECKTLWFKNTKAYAKRQTTWFRAENGIVWFAPDEEEKIMELAVRWKRAGSTR